MARHIGDIPGAALVLRGLEDARAGRTTVESLLVATAAPRLAALGLGPADTVSDAELRLYALIGQGADLDPYSRYNALKRELASFVRALEHRLTRERSSE